MDVSKYCEREAYRNDVENLSVYLIKKHADCDINTDLMLSADITSFHCDVI
jgi:hypothetical protein